MNVRPGTIGAAIVVVVVGFAIGGWLAFVGRTPESRPARVTVASTMSTPAPLRPTAPTATATSTATAVPATKPPPTVASVATAVPIAEVTAAPTVLPHSVAVQAAPQGSWELDEANTQVGTIVWAADTVLARGSTVVLDAHKQSVGGRAAVPCERHTSLHAEFAAGAAEQSVPYREVNCEGTVSTGELHVTYPGNNGSFSGSFWHNGVKLGDFNARKR